MVTAAHEREGHVRVARKGAVSLGEVFVPHPISHLEFNFCLKTMALESRAVADLVRFDERMRHYPYRSALLTSLKRAEAMATVRTDGISPETEQVLLFEASERQGKGKPREQKQFVRGLAADSTPESREASFEAFRCVKALCRIMDAMPPTRPVRREDIDELQRICVRGTKRERCANLRKDDGEIEYYPGSSQIAYCPPKADRIVPLIDDLVEFSNRKDISPVIKGIIAHFQLEAIQPYREGLDRLGRMLALLIMRSAGLFENIVPPFSLTPAVQTQNHTERLIPYRTGQPFEWQNVMPALDKWVEHSSKATDRSVKYASIYSARIKELVDGWRTRLGDVRCGSSLDTLLSELPGIPILCSTGAAAAIGCSYQTANECIAQLTEVGIISPVTATRRNRLFRSDDAIAMLKGIEALFMPDKAVPRKEFYAPRILLRYE